MKTNVLFVFTLFLLVTFCEREEHVKNDRNFENQTFVHKYFKTEKQCMDAQNSDFFINCHAQLNFLEHGEAEIMVTDIIWRGNYKVIKNTIILNFPHNFELPEETLVFKILNNEKLKRIDDNTIWEKLNGDSLWE
tara:strand:+ start:53 stop:457 length:405 start_codon:yes stop_codon:yes gene_type:complete